MAYLSSTSAKITPENYSARVKSITVRVCVGITRLIRIIVRK